MQLNTLQVPRLVQIQVSTVHKWKPTTVSEMKLFLGVSMLMGVVHNPNIEMYRSQSTLFATPAFRGLMTRNRYCLILKFLRFSNSD